MTQTSTPPRSGNTAHALVTPGFGARLIRARLAAGFTSQPLLARAAGVSVNTVCRHELERVPPSLAAITSYARVLRVSAAYLQYGIGDPSVPPAVQHYLRSMRGMQLLPETQARLIAMPWSLLVDGEVSEAQVHAIARVVDGNLRARGDLRHAQRLSGGEAEVPGDDGA